MLEVTVAEAETKLASLIEAARSGVDIVITDNNMAVARLVPSKYPTVVRERKPGSAKGKILYIADDFDAPLNDFAEYM